MQEKVTSSSDVSDDIIGLFRLTAVELENMCYTIKCLRQVLLIYKGQANAAFKRCLTPDECKSNDDLVKCVLRDTNHDRFSYFRLVWNLYAVQGRIISHSINNDYI